MPSTSAKDKVDTLNTKLTALIDALEANPAMNHANPPATNKPLWFMWDFVQRTRFNLNGIDISKLEADDPAAVEVYSDVLGRCMLTNVIISDTTRQTIEKMVGEKAVDFGPDARAKAAALNSGSSVA